MHRVGIPRRDSRCTARRHAEPNPAVPFSFFSMTHYRGSVCLPVYEANSGARAETTARYSSIFGKNDFLDYIRLALTNETTATPARLLGEKCVSLVAGCGTELCSARRPAHVGDPDQQCGAACCARAWHHVASEELGRISCSPWPISD